MLRIFNKTRYNLHQVARYDFTFGENSSSPERSDYSPESKAISFAENSSGLPSVRIVRPESEATIVPRAKRFGISFAENSSGLTASRLKCFAFSLRCGITSCLLCSAADPFNAGHTPKNKKTPPRLPGQRGTFTHKIYLI